MSDDRWLDIRAVLFDAVGTLIYPDPPVAQAYYSRGKEFGSNLTVDEVANRFAAAFAKQEEFDAHVNDSPPSLRRKPTNPTRERQRWQQIVADVFHEVADVGGALFEVLWDHFARPTSWRLFSDATPTWEQFSRRGDLTLGIASNFDDRIVDVFRELAPFVDDQIIFHSAGLGHSKPDPDFFRCIQQQLNFAPEQILLVGDDPINDVQGAIAAGWQAILVNRTSGERTCGEIGSLDELPM